MAEILAYVTGMYQTKMYTYTCYVYNICSQSSENFLYGILSYLSCIPLVPGRDMGNQYVVK